MNTAVMYAVACVALAVPLLAWSFTARPDAVRRQAVHNLNRSLGTPSGVDTGPVVEGGRVVALARRLTPSGLVRTLDGLLARAGRPAAWPLERVLVSKLVLVVAVAGLSVLLVGTTPGLRMGALAVFSTGLAWVVPELLLHSQGQKRRKAVELALPDTLDQLTIAVEAGLGFEAAMAHVARNSKGPLPEELVRTLQDIQVGQPRRTAYLALAERTGALDLKRFVRAIVQADQHGVSIARVLATQAEEMRLKRRQRAEEKAMQIPVKVVFPLILFILPVLFIVVLGPAALNIIEAFSE